MARRDPADPKTPDGQVKISDFGGFVTDADPHDLDPGLAVKQINATSVKAGELRARPGVRVVLFD
jgi:hypothetical protein